MKLLIKLLYSLGILKYKISFNEFLEHLKKITDLSAEEIMKDDIKDQNLRDKGLSEIKIYLWILSINSFNKLPQDVITKIGIHFRNHIIFSNINLTEDEEIRLLEERIPFHENNLSRIINNNESSMKYTEMLSMLFYSKPFVDIDYIENPVDCVFRCICATHFGDVVPLKKE
jgi:hypothetical protein